jgi:hypothetical protein
MRQGLELAHLTGDGLALVIPLASEYQDADRHVEQKAKRSARTRLRTHRNSDYPKLAYSSQLEQSIGAV